MQTLTVTAKQPLWIARRDLYTRLCSAQNTCAAYKRPCEFDNALGFIDTEAQFVALVERAEEAAAEAKASYKPRRSRRKAA